MKKTMKRLFAILMTLAIVITAIPMMEVKAAEEDIAVSITFDKTDFVITNDNANSVYLTATLTVSGVEKEISHISTGYENVNDGNVKWITFWGTEDNGVFSSGLNDISRSNSGEYEIFLASIVYADETTYTIPFENLPDASFNIDNKSDRTAPIISNVFMSVKDKEGNVVNPDNDGEYFLEQGEGYIIEVSADVADPDTNGEVTAGIDEEYVKAYILPTSEENSCDYYPLSLTKNSDGKYSATVPVDGTSENDYTDAMTNCEFYLEYVEVYDLRGNNENYFPNEKGEDYHFYVTKNEETVLPTYENIKLYFYDENDELLIENPIIIEETTRKTSLKDLLGDNIPKVDDKLISDLGFLGWETIDIEEYITNETEFFIPYDDKEFEFYPVFEKKYVEVTLQILDEDGKLDMTGYEEYIIDKDARYQDLIVLLPTPPSVNGFTFVEWDLGGYELTDIVESDLIVLWAVYDKQIKEVSCYYMDEDGKFANETMMLIFPTDETVTYEKVLAQVPKFETYEGVNLVKWNILDGTTDTTQEVEGDWVGLEAIYDKYPVKIDRTYVDTTGAVKNEKVTKLYPAGTTMESIYNEYAVKPSDADSSLEITEWSVIYIDPYEISFVNNDISLTAQYDEKVIVEVSYGYIASMDDHGVEKMVYSYEVVEKNIVSDEDAMIEYCKNTVEGKLTFEHYNGFQFLGWDYESAEFEDADNNGIIDTVNVIAKFNYNEVISLVAFIGMDMIPIELDTVYYYVVKVGDTVVLPDQYDGYYLTWYDMMSGDKLNNDKYTVPADAIAGNFFMVKAVKGEKVPEQVTPPADTDTNPGNNVPKTGDTSNVLPYMTLLLLGAGVFMVGNKKRELFR